MFQPIFITGIGTGIGKTVVSAIVTEALHADYWKPVQAGFEDGTDAGEVAQLVTNTGSVIHPELYKLAMPASPHIAARKEKKIIDAGAIVERYRELAAKNRRLVIEGAGGLMVPLNEHTFVSDLIQRLQAKVILVSRNYLGSINHSLLTAAVCKEKKLDVAGWIFNDQYMDYEDEIVQWTGLPKIGSVSFAGSVNRHFVKAEADKIKGSLESLV